MKNQAQIERKNSRSRNKQKRQSNLGLLSKKEAARFRFVPLTEMQVMQLDNPSRPKLREFLRIATLDQLIQLRGTTPVACCENVLLKNEPRFKLHAISNPTPKELSHCNLTSREAESRRRMVVKEAEFRSI